MFAVLFSLARHFIGFSVCFTWLSHGAVADPRLVALMSLRSDFLGQVQNDEPLFAVHCKIDVPPLRERELNRVIREPAQQLGARF